MTYAARITGTGSAFPPNRVTNVDLSNKLALLDVHTSDQWIRERTGIVERRYADLSQESIPNASLAAAAAEKALLMAGKKAEEVDQIIVGTCSPDTLLPSTACRLQDKLGARKAWAMDINAACSGFVYGAVTATQFIMTG
ncbi:MAG: 3-oxoacyl-ACP synthase, partial [Desulfobacteraceae bacterium]